MCECNGCRPNRVRGGGCQCEDCREREYRSILNRIEIQEPSMAEFWAAREEDVSIAF